MDEVVGKTVVKVGMDYSEIKQGITNLNAQMKVADATWKSTLSTFKQSDRSIEKLTTSIKGMSEKLRVQEQLIEAHKVNVAKLTKEYGANSTKVLNATANLKKQEGIYGNLKRSINEMNNEIAENNAKLKDNSIQQRIVNGQQEKMLKQSQMLEKQQASMTSKLKLADQEWKNNVTSLGNVYKAVDKAQVNLDGLNKKYNIQKKIVIEHSQELRKLSATYGDNDERVVQANLKLKEQIGIFKGMKNDINNVTKELNELKRAEQLNNSPWTQRTKELQAYSDKMSSIGDKMTNIGQNMSMTVTAPIAAGFGAAVKTSMDFEAQMSRVGAIAGASKSDLKAMTDQAMQLGASTSKSASEVAKGFEEMAAMGFSVKEIMGAMPGVISASESSGADMAQTAKVMASSMNAFGLEASKSTHIADVLAQTANQSAADITDMEYALKYAGAPAEALGVSLEETAAAIGLVVDKGMKGEQAGTGIKNMMLTLAENSQTTQKRLESIGLEVHDAEGKFIGISGVIEGLNKQLKGMSDMEKTGVLASLFGKESAPAVLSLIEAGSDKIDKMTVSLENSDGASAKAAKQMKNNLKGALEELGGAFETVGIQVGKDLTPMIRGLAKGIQGLANGFSELPGWARKTAVGIGLIAAATSPLLIGFGMVANGASAASRGLSVLTGRYALNTAAAETNAAANLASGTAIGKQGRMLGGVSGLFTKFGKASGTAASSTGLLARGAGLLRTGLGVLSGPVGITIAAITALYTTFKLAYKHIDWFKTGVDNTGKLLNEMGVNINFDWVGKIGTGMKVAGKWIGDTTGKIAKLGFEMSPIGMISKATFGVVNESVKKATDQVDLYGKGVSKSTEKALRGYTDLSQKAKLKLETLRASHKTIGEKQYQELVQLYNKMANTAVSKIQQRRNREITGLQKLFADTKGLKASEENKILAEAKTGNNKEVQAVREKQRQIKAIYAKAHREKRALTDIEESRIVVLQQKMDRKVVQSLSKSEKEQRIILGRLKTNKKALSIQAAAEVIKASAKERDETIKNAKSKKKKIIDEAIYQRDVTKNISKKQAEAIIKSAEKQYKGSVKNAKDQHKKVVDEASRQNKDVKKEIDSQTGHVLSKWQKLKRQTGPVLTGIRIASVKAFEDSKKGISKWMGQTSSDVSKRWSGIKKSTGNFTESIRKTAVGKYEELKKGTTKWLSSASTAFSTKWGEIKKNTTSFAEGVRKAAVDKFEQMYKKSTSWVTSIGSFIDKAKSGIATKAGNMGKSVANSAIDGLNAMIGGINSIAKGITGESKLINRIPRLSTGKQLNKDTLAVVGDKGPGNGPNGFTREIIKRKDGSMHLTPAKDTLVYLGKEDEVINGRTTHALMKSGAIPHYSTGRTKLGKDAENKKKKKGVADYGLDLLKGAGSSALTNASKVFGSDKVVKGMKSASKAADKVKDLGEEIFDYIDNPGKLVNMVIGPLKEKFVGVGGATGKIALGAFNNIKSKLVKTVQGWFDEFGGGNADGSSFSTFDISTGYYPNSRPPGYPHPAHHYGVDFVTPQGHPINAPTSGMLTHFLDGRGGLTGILTDKIYTQFFMHMQSLRKDGPIKKGTFLGKTGGDPSVQPNSGSWSNGPHLHYQVKVNDGNPSWNTNTMNPLDFLRKHGDGGPAGGGGTLRLMKGKGFTHGGALYHDLGQTPANVSASGINKWLSGTGMAGLGNVFMQAGRASGLDPRYLVAHAAVETGWGRSAMSGRGNVARGNWFGIGAFDNNPNNGFNYGLGVVGGAKWIRQNFYNRGQRSVHAMRRNGGVHEYATAQNWDSMIANIMANGSKYMYANGGIIKKPHYGLVGEDGPEAIIPLDPKKKTRAQQLLAYASSVINKKTGQKETNSRKYVKEPPKTHRVKYGDTLWGISTANKMTVDALKKLNNLKSNLILPGQILKLNNGAYKLVGAIKEHASALKKTITKKPTTLVKKAKPQMTTLTGVISKFADGLVRTGTIFKDLKTAKTDLSFGKFLESKLKGLNSTNIKTVITNISDIKKKVTEIDKKNEKLIKTNNTKIKSATVKNFDEQLRIDNYKAEKALKGKKGTITVKTRIAARDTTMIDRSLAKARLNKESRDKTLKALRDYEFKVLKRKPKTSKEKNEKAILLSKTKRRIAEEQKLRDKEITNIKKFEAQRADALKLKYKTEKKYVKGRSVATLDKLINNSVNNIGKNNTLIKNLKSENALYAKQKATLKQINGAEILKSDVLKKIAARREQLINMMSALKKKEASLKEEKEGFANSISENLQSYAGFAGARGHTARDFVSWMRYRLNKMRQFASNVQKLKGMGLDPKLIREMLAGGIESAMPKVEALVKGGGGYIGQINSLQKEIDKVVKSISTEQSTSLFADELASNKRRQDVVTKAMKSNEARLDKFRKGKDKVISMKGYTDLENKSSKFKYQPTPLPKKATVKATTKIVNKKHKVVKGDSLTSLAKKYGVTVAEIRNANKGKTAKLTRGEVLIIPTKVKTTSSKTSNTSGTYKIKAGDSLGLIAQKYKTTVAKLKKVNNLKSDLIHPNQILKVPGVTKSAKVINLEAAKKKREEASTRLIINTAKKLNVVGKHDKYAAQLQKEISDIKKSKSKNDDILITKLEKEMKENKALTKEMVSLLSQILHKPTNVILDGQKVSKTVEKNIVSKAKTTARKTVTPKPKTTVRRKA
ncbi:phage tail tape measure protein [Macrococcus equi]|uniref:phage tail tape measure protein n=1 Tax=Macrococcus equi TaxID=3395462 RepID=UPI0039BDBD0D